MNPREDAPRRSILMAGALMLVLGVGAYSFVSADPSPLESSANARASQDRVEASFPGSIAGSTGRSAGISTGATRDSESGSARESIDLAPSFSTVRNPGTDFAAATDFEEENWTPESLAELDDVEFVEGYDDELDGLHYDDATMTMRQAMLEGTAEDRLAAATPVAADLNHPLQHIALQQMASLAPDAARDEIFRLVKTEDVQQQGRAAEGLAAVARAGVLSDGDLIRLTSSASEFVEAEAARALRDRGLPSYWKDFVAENPAWIEIAAPEVDAQQQR